MLVPKDVIYEAKKLAHDNVQTVFVVEYEDEFDLRFCFELADEPNVVKIVGSNGLVQDF